MLSAALAVFALITPFSIGHVDSHGNEPHSARFTVTGSHLTMTLPPHTSVDDLSQCTWLDVKRVTYNNGHKLSRVWDDYKTEYVFGGTVTFDGMRVTNYSRTRWINIRATLYRGC